MKPTHPTIYEINTPIFLREVGVRVGYAVTLADVPDDEWDAIVRPGVDTIWFMGIWKRSATAREMAKNEPWLKDSLPDLREEDILGSAYSIQEYVVDERCGGNKGLAAARAKLRERGIKIILDYIPNHVGIDHVWATERPEYFLTGSSEELAAAPGSFAQTPGGIFAKGKDPNFEPWSDVLQLNAFSLAHRQGVARTLQMIAAMSDGVRCDMAMLMMNGIFSSTWGTRAGEVPATEYWPAAIQAAKQVNPEFLFLAEVYWDKQQDLLAQGFDLCYDKDLYDELLIGSALSIKEHLQKTDAYKDQLLRFLENHDEERAAHEFIFEKHRAAAVLTATLPGAHLYHDGQREGRQVRVPVHVGRRIDEPNNEMTAAFYDKLFGFLDTTKLLEGEWKLVHTVTGLFRRESRQVLAWAWKNDTSERFFVVNYSAHKAHVKVDFNLKNAQNVTHQLVPGTANFEQKSSSVLSLDPWQVLAFEIKK